MAITKVCGIETEYGIQVISPGDMSPTTASSLLINAYVAQLERKIGWDFEDESPGRDARGYAREGSMPPEIETHLVNAVLTNGARYYVDHAHPEYSTPECSNALEVVLHDRAGELVLRRSMEAAGQLLAPGEGIVIYKNNSDGKGNSYGCHENYLLDRALPFSRIVHELTPHLVTRQIYTGAGKIGEETSHGAEIPPFQLSQRSDFFEEEVGLETTLKRPIINTRDEPHADPQKYRRLHVIVGDANLAEVATFLKVGVTALVLAMIEDDFHPARDLRLARPVAAIRAVSRDPTLRTRVELASGGSLTASSCSGSSTTSPASTPLSGGSRRSGTRRWLAWCSTAGTRSCRVSKAIPSRSRASSTGSPSFVSWRPTRTATVFPGTTPSLPASISSTTTSALQNPCSQGLRWRS